MYFHPSFSLPCASLLFLLLTVTNTANSAAISAKRSLSIRDVYSPKILTPDATTVWQTGTHGVVTWKPPPANIPLTNRNGTILLGHLSDTGGENLDIKHPLASYVDLSLGNATIEVPKVPAGKYIIVLMGDSGNKSPEFEIQSVTGSAPSTADAEVPKLEVLRVTLALPPQILDDIDYDSDFAPSEFDDID